MMHLAKQNQTKQNKIKQAQYSNACNERLWSCILRDPSNDQFILREMSELELQNHFYQFQMIILNILRNHITQMNLVHSIATHYSS